MKYCFLRKDIPINFKVIPAFVDDMKRDSERGFIFEVVENNKKDDEFLIRHNAITIKNRISQWNVKRKWLRPALEHEVVAARLRGEI